jgi:hypothetical protein
MVLRNHGLLTFSPSVAQAFNTIYNLELACRSHVDAMAARTELTLPPQEVLDHAPAWTSPAPAVHTASSSGTRCGACLRPTTGTRVFDAILALSAVDAHQASEAHCSACSKNDNGGKMKSTCVKSVGERLALGAFALTLISATGGAAAQGADAARSFPSKPIRLIVPFPPGGSNDILGRFMAQKMTERLGQQTIVDNRAGADGIIGTELASRAPPDGYTLLIVSTSYTQNPAVHKLPYDPVKSLMAIAMIGSGANVLAVTPSLPVKSLKELIALAKSKPGALLYASSGIGGFNHFGGELFKTMAGVNLVHRTFDPANCGLWALDQRNVRLFFRTYRLFRKRAYAVTTAVSGGASWVLQAYPHRSSRSSTLKSRRFCATPIPRSD